MNIRWGNLLMGKMIVAGDLSGTPRVQAQRHALLTADAVKKAYDYHVNLPVAPPFFTTLHLVGIFF
ncbi:MULTISPECIES: hypothetical protein [unclassified Serratia (in: enterobacteria)]|uniref:hypothetical protein n=1 Tax=unclassified Serratia (in: enterobacteria) TaxID=2647522 RepID=UPI00307642AB